MLILFPFLLQALPTRRRRQMRMLTSPLDSVLAKDFQLLR